MKTRTTILLTAMATFTLFTLFAYCSKDEKDSNGDNGGTLTTLKLSGTTWKTIKYYSEGTQKEVFVNFTTENSGKCHWVSDQAKGDVNFTYSLKGIHGTVNSSSGDVETFFPNNAVLEVIDENTIGIGGRVFAKQ